MSQNLINLDLPATTITVLDQAIAALEEVVKPFITLTPDHDAGRIAFRVINVGGFGVLNTVYPAAQVTPSLLDELAKKLVGQPSRFG